jgi:hypothetical protein
MSGSSARRDQSRLHLNLLSTPPSQVISLLRMRYCMGRVSLPATSATSDVRRSLLKRLLKRM